jgi:hypothetical protein
MQGSKSNHNHPNDLQPASSTIATYLNQKEHSGSVCWLGETASEFNMDMTALTSGIAHALNICTDPATPQIAHITILSPSPTAIQAIQNLRAHARQSLSLEFNKALTCIFSTNRNIRINIAWYPSNLGLAGAKKCCALACHHAATPFPPNHHEPNLIAFQKTTAKEEAIAAWQACWHNSPHTTDAYTALPHPPSGTLPPVIEGATGNSRLTSTTLVYLITGHAFISSYMAHFHPNKSTHCPLCSVNPQTVPHIIKYCPHYVAERATFLLPVAPDLSLATLSGTREGGAALIQFLKMTKACYTLREEPFNPG